MEILKLKVLLIILFLQLVVEPVVAGLVCNAKPLVSRTTNTDTVKEFQGSFDQDHMFVSGFIDLKGFRDQTNNYVNSIKVILEKAPRVVMFCEPNLCKHLRTVSPALLNTRVRLIEIQEDSLQIFSKYKGHVVDANTHMLHEFTEVKHLPVAQSDALQISTKNTDYMLVMYLKFELLQKAAELNPFNSTYMTWIDAGIYRHPGMIGKHDLSRLDTCFKTTSAILATSQQRKCHSWPPEFNTVYLYQDRREVAGTMMTFNQRHYMKTFMPRFMEIVEELFARKLLTTDQAVLTLYVQKYAKEVDFRAVGYDNILGELFSCSNLPYRETWSSA